MIWVLRKRNFSRSNKQRERLIFRLQPLITGNDTDTIHRSINMAILQTQKQMNWVKQQGKTIDVKRLARELNFLKAQKRILFED